MFVYEKFVFNFIIIVDSGETNVTIVGAKYAGARELEQLFKIARRTRWKH